MNSDNNNFVYFNDVLHATLREAFKEYITADADLSVLEYVRGQEIRTQKLIEKSRQKVIKKNCL